MVRGISPTRQRSNELDEEKLKIKKDLIERGDCGILAIDNAKIGAKFLFGINLPRKDYDIYDKS